MVYPSGLSASSSGLPSLSSIGSAQVAACPVFASPSPATPQTCLHPNMQYPPPQLAPVMEEGKIDFNRERSLLYPNFRSKVVMPQASQGQSINGCNALLLLSTPGLQVLGSFGIMQSQSLRQHINNGQKLLPFYALGDNKC